MMEGTFFLKRNMTNGKITRWQNLPNTHLPVSKVVQNSAETVECCYYEYDDHNHLIKERIQSGPKSISKNYILRQEQPFLHMPEWIEERYLEDDREKLLSNASDL